MNEPQITLAIPFRGRWRFLRSAVESALAQTDPRWRMIICDNASGDPEVESQLRSFDDPRISYVNNGVDLGIVGNFNRCLDLAATDLVTLLHSDDCLAPKYCETMIAAAQSRPGAVGHFCRPQAIDEHGLRCFSAREFVKRIMAPGRSHRLLILQGERAAASLLRAHYICSPSMCFRKSILGDRRFDKTWGQVMDIELHVRLLMAGETIVGLPATLYCYRRHSGQTTARNIEDVSFFREHARLYRELRQRAHARGWRRLSAAATRPRIVLAQAIYWALADLAAGRPKRSWQKAAFVLELSRRRGVPSRSLAESELKPHL